MKYKVGDKVVVRRDLSYYRSYGRCEAVSNMVDFRCKIVTIKRVYDHYYRIVESGWCWTDEMFEGLYKDDVQIEVGDLL